ncbi:MAG: hypothetical protein HEQ29_16300 [Dolichospermum sp. LBC05a]|nr:hypothetical protein [Dolichospermum sp. OL01]MCO5798257.1 hypothetical protein [Dolichospermum sp. OL03]MCS6281853.1 hypothetical protein [Dolichospermum sp.]QSV59715.1 MAG: hypothetical protein HEQ29_16300 [Dolichospermum sp. LBC05a]
MNGECYDSALYNTPGSFATLADCNAACGGGGENCPPGMICLDAAEFSQIEELSAALKDSVC